MRLLVLDAYPRQLREALRDAGGTEAGRLYERMLSRLRPDAAIELAWPADSDFALPAGRRLADYDGMTWTGSSLSILEPDTAPVRRQIELARAASAAGVPEFGSCWAVQLACVAAGGSCRANPKGREFGISRAISLSREGRAHPLYRGKPAVFDAFTSHADEVHTLPAGGLLLASNAFTRVQAVALDAGAASFWAVQYHPEYDTHEVASLCRLRMDELLGQGSFRNRAAARRFVDALEELHEDSAREDLAQELRLDPALLDSELRTLELRNWLERRVEPRVSARG